MSEHSQAIVDLDATGDEVERIAAGIRSWLLAEGVVVVNASRDELWHPSELAPGPSWSLITDDPLDTFLTLANNGVDLVVERRVFDSGENFTPPPCPTCGQKIAEGDYIDKIGSWLAGPEPLITCPTCRASHRIGDWRSRWAFAVGHFGLEFNNWPMLSEPFLAEVARRLTPHRTAVVNGHY